MAETTKADIQKTIDEEIVPELQETLAEKVGFYARVLDKSDFAIQGVDTVSFPYRDKRNAQELGVDDDVLEVAGTMKSDSMPLNVVLADAFTLKRHLAKESRINIAASELEEITNAIIRGRDKKIYDTLFATAPAANAIERTASIADDIADMRKALRDNKVSVTDGLVTLALNNTDYAKVTKSADFKNVDSFGARGEELKAQGVLGKIYGMWVMEHDYAESFAFHRNAVAYADHGDMLVMEDSSSLKMGDTWSVSLKTGYKALKNDGADVSPYVVKLIDPVV